MTNALTINLGARSYAIEFSHDGWLAQLASALAHIKAKKLIPVLIDENVSLHHKNKMELFFAQTDYDLRFITIKSGESSKSLGNYAKICDILLKLRIERGTVLVALGGGVVGDLTGFLAATLLRGIDFIQIPTSLLAMVDSSVGGKTAVNSRYGKNMVGAFHQPRAVLIDSAFLHTLPAQEFSAGMAEVIKYGAIESEEFLHFIARNHAQIMAKDTVILHDMIRQSVAFKARIVELDEREGGVRAHLNFGHSFAHALEHHYHFNISHGFAVAVGMVLALDFAAYTQLFSDTEYRHFVAGLLKKFALPTKLADLPETQFTAQKLTKSMEFDKKVIDGKVTLILPKAKGAVAVHKSVSNNTIRQFYQQKIKEIHA